MGREKKTDRRTMLWLWALMGFICLVVFHNYIFGNETVAFYDAGSDTKDQYLMWYNGIVNSLRNGTFSAWDFRNGYGMNAIGHNLTDPFLIPVFLLGVLFGPEHLAFYMVYSQVAKILIAGTAVYFYLSEFELQEKPKLAASLMYAFNGFMMVWGQHYALGTGVALLPFLLRDIEQVLKRPRFHVRLCLTSALMLLASFYQGYMCMLGGGIYTCVRIFMKEKESIKKKWQGFLLTAGSMLMGVWLSAFRLLPSAAAQVGSSGRLESEKSLLARLLGGVRLWNKDILKTIVYRFFSSNLQGNAENVYLGKRNYYEDANLFFSTLFVILLCQYLFLIPRQNCGKKKKAVQYLIVLLMGAALVCPAVSIPFNGFYAPFFRHTFLMMPVFAVMSAWVLDEIIKKKRIHVPALMIAVLVMTAVYAKGYTLFVKIPYKTNSLYLWLTGVGMALVLYLAVKRKMEENVAVLLFGILLIGNITSDSRMCYEPREALPKVHPVYYEETYHSSTNDALLWLEEYDNSFYRVEKDYFSASSCLDSQAQDYRGISAYNSNQNKYVKEFIDVLWPQMYNENDPNHIQFANAVWDPIMASLSGVKYVLSKSGDFNVPGYTFLHQTGDVFIYENLRSDSIAKFYDKTITREAFEKEQKNLNVEALLTEVLIVEEEDAFTIDEAEEKGYEKKEIRDILNVSEDSKQAAWTFTVKEGALNAYQGAVMEFDLKVSGRTEVRISINDAYEHTLVVNKKNPHFRLELPSDTEKIVFAAQNTTEDITLSKIEVYGFEKETEFPDGAVITIDAPKKDDFLTGKIKAEKDGIVMLSIPFEKGWSIYLDGEKQELFTGDYGFISFAVNEGEYDIEAVFEAPMQKEGNLASIIGVGAFLCLIWIKKKRGMRHDLF